MVQLYRYSCCDWLLWYRYRYKLERQSGIVTTQHQVTVHAHVSCTLIIYVNPFPAVVLYTRLGSDREPARAL